jgi:putative transposase
VIRPQDWNWSSYCAHVGEVESPAWLDSASLHRQLATRAPCEEGPARYAQFVMQGCGVQLWEEALKGQIYLGCEHFVERMQAYVTSSDEKEIPQTQRRPATQSLQYYFNRYPRDMAIVQAFLEGGHTQTAIAEIADLSVSRISRLIKAAQAKDKT